MKVQLEKKFPLQASADAAWALLADIEAVAGCMPGARITERLDESHYKGTVAVKFGPANLSFRGEVEIKQLDAAARTLQLVGKGTDTTGGSGATMDLTARVEAVDAANCHLLGTSEVAVSGKAATFGGRMMSAVADQVMAQFVANFAAKLKDMPPPAAPGQAAEAASAAAPAAAAAPSQLNGLALLWAVFKSWLRSLFKPKQT